MIAIFLALVTLASAAPHYDFRPHYHHHRNADYGLSEDLFDVNKLWKELESELRQMDEAIKELTKQFPITTSFNEEIVGDEYKLTIGLTGFEEKDITVKAKEGVLMIQAVHDSPDGNQRSYIDLRTLPSNINVAGAWTYQNEVLKIEFPLLKKPDEEGTTVAPIDNETSAPIGSREVMEENGNENIDADVGLRGDKDREQIETNEISSNGFEATTYAVDLKDEVEFVPMKYKK